METLEDVNEEAELDAESEWQPVELQKDRSYVLPGLSSGEYAGASVCGRLEDAV